MDVEVEEDSSVGVDKCPVASLLLLESMCKKNWLGRTFFWIIKLGFTVGFKALGTIIALSCES